MKSPTRSISIRIPQDMASRAENLAEANSISINSILRFCIFRQIALMEREGIMLDAHVASNTDADSINRHNQTSPTLP